MQIVAFHTADGKSNFKDILKRCFIANFDHQKNQTKRELSAEADELAQSLLNDNSTIKQLEGYLLNQEPCAQCAVIEEGYIDRDFLDDYVSYHSRCFENQSRQCCRVHFFSENFTENNDLEDLILSPETRTASGLVRIESAYLGFLIVRPLRKTIVGRTCLKPYAQENHRGAALPGRHYPAVCRNRVSFFGVELTVECMPFQEQDGATAACATCVLWSAFSVSAPLFRNRIPSPSTITALAVENSFSSTREFPNHGLSVEEMCYAIRKTGLDPIVVRLDNYSNLMERTHMFLGAVYAYLNLGVSVIAVLDDKGNNGNGITKGVHAIAINGYHLPEKPDASKWLVAMNIDKLYANDDQCCPGARFVPKWTMGTNLKLEAHRGPSEQSEIYRTYIPRSLIIPLYHKIHVTLEEVAKEVNDCVGCLGTVLKTTGASLNIQLDITLRQSNDFKQSIREDVGLSREKRLLIVKDNLPRFVWCVRMDYSGRHAVTILVDTTDSEQGLNVIGVIFYNCNLADAVPENAIRYMVRYAFSRSHRRDFDLELRQKMEQQPIFRALCGFENIKKDFALLSKRANNGDADDHFQLGWMHEYGIGTSIDKTAAVHWYKKSADRGCADAQFNLGWIYEHGDGVKVDKEKAIDWYMKAADCNEIAAMYRIATIYHEAGKIDDAIKWYEKAAQGDHLKAQYELANICDSLTQKDRSMSVNAAKWYEKAASRGHRESQYTLGKMYAHGLWGVQTSPRNAFKWYRMAAQQGHADAQYRLAQIYDKGNADVPKNDALAVFWYTKAAEQGHKEAQHALGLLFERMFEFNNAITWYVAAAEQGHPESQYRLGVIYEQGICGTIDIALAVMWYKKAAAQSHRQAQAALKRLQA